MAGSTEEKGAKPLPSGLASVISRATTGASRCLGESTVAHGVVAWGRGLSVRAFAALFRPLCVGRPGTHQWGKSSEPWALSL